MAPPRQALELLGVPGHSWSEPLQGGLEGRSFLGQDYVVQRRPGLLAEHQRVAREILGGLCERESQLMAGTRSYGPLVAQYDDRFTGFEAGMGEPHFIWTAAPRLEGITLKASAAGEDELLGCLETCLGGVERQLGLIAELDYDALLKTRPHRGIEVQLMDQQQAAELFAQLGDKADRVLGRMPEEPVSRVVLSHGDPILRNWVIGEVGARLIDFEGLWPLPRGRDWTHMVAHLALHTELDTLNRCAGLIWQVARGQLEGWGEDEWRAGCAWHMVREVSLWGRFKDQLPLYVERLERFVG